jgi:hypothetical protein
MLSLCVCARACARVCGVRVRGGFYLYLVFKSLSIIGECPVNRNLLDPKDGPKKTKLQFFLMVLMISIT